MSTDDFPLLDAQPPHPATRHPDATSVTTTGDYYYSDHDKSAATPSSKRNHQSHYYNNNNKRSKSNSNTELESSDYRDYRKDREEWSDTAISCLLEAYTEKYNQLNRGNLRGRDWEEVAEARYKVELQRISGSASSWHWFKHIEAIMGNASNGKSSSGGAAAGGDSEGGGGGGGGGGSCGNVNVVVKQVKRYTSGSATFANSLKTKPVSNLKWRRVVFKISGSALAGNCQNIDPKVAMQIAQEVATASRVGLEIAIVLGGRNFFCGDSWISATGLERPTAYQIGMMATVMNSILLQSALEKHGNGPSDISRKEELSYLVDVGAGAGNPLFTTDTAAALRASEINADALLKGTSVNGVYDRHAGNSNILLDHISFRDVVSRGATSMDMMAITYCEENGIPVVVFNLLEPGNISRALCGDQVGTLIDQAGRIG
ncbi:KINASE putative-RELATED [Salix viminalis]|uniref:UMP kinase n=1 Tax=Salix viminalis TaxID=40686 RepID=A0A9Q0TYM2_SALVM|nr:KINASE putative-RELATED [Salix viminalis]